MQDRIFRNKGELAQMLNSHKKSEIYKILNIDKNTLDDEIKYWNENEDTTKHNKNIIIEKVQKDSLED